MLLDDWIRSSRVLSRDEALQTLAERYFTSHGPASVRDFANWTGLSLTDARTALQLAKSWLASIESSGDELWMSSALDEPAELSHSVHLLPGFDEYLLGYRDRGAPCSQPSTWSASCPVATASFRRRSSWMELVRGTWRRSIRGRRNDARCDAVRPVVGGVKEGDRCRGPPVRRISRRTGGAGVDELTSVPATPASGACSPRRCAPGTGARPTGSRRRCTARR